MFAALAPRNEFDLTDYRVEAPAAKEVWDGKHGVEEHGGEDCVVADERLESLLLVTVYKDEHEHDDAEDVLQQIAQ